MREIARREIRRLAVEERGVVSTQVLLEYVAAARKRLGFSLTQCRQGVLLIGRFDVTLIRPEHILGALDLATTYSLSHWDALILRWPQAQAAGPSSPGTFSMDRPSTA